MAKMTAAHRDEGFQAWLAMNEYLLDCEFTAGDVPGLPADPYTKAGLDVAETNALERFRGIDEALAPENREMYDEFVRYVGEVFVRQFHGRWVNRTSYSGDGAYLGVVFPWDSDPLTIPTLVTSAVGNRTGDEWSTVFGFKQRARDEAGT